MTGNAELPAFDRSVANPARIWNYWLGGKDNFAADREAAEKVLEVIPSMRLLARLAREQLIDAVRQLVGEFGIRQFLDIGTGLPTASNTHEIAGSFLVVGHGASDIHADAVPEMTRRYNERASASLTLRNRDEVTRFFDGLELIEPGVVPLNQWWRGHRGAGPAVPGSVLGYCGIARKPLPG